MHYWNTQALFLVSWQNIVYASLLAFLFVDCTSLTWFNLRRLTRYVMTFCLNWGVICVCTVFVNLPRSWTGCKTLLFSTLRTTFRLTSSTINLVWGQHCSQSSNKWKSNEKQSASHRLSVRNPSKVTLDEVQPSARCLFRWYFINLFIVLGWSSL